MKRWKAWMMKLLGLPTCEEVAEFAYAYLEGQLDPQVEKDFERHLEGCGDCERFVQTYREVARPENYLPEIKLDPEFERRVLAFLKNRR